MSLSEFLAQRWPEIVELSLEHVGLVVVSIGLAVVLAVPLGLVVTRIGWLARPILGFSGVVQTVPSLALFGLLLPLPLIGGLGNRTAIIALVLYALLPILRNTVTGVRSVDPAVLDAADGRAPANSAWLIAGAAAAAAVSLAIVTATMTGHPGRRLVPYSLLGAGAASLTLAALRPAPWILALGLDLALIAVWVEAFIRHARRGLPIAET